MKCIFEVGVLFIAATLITTVEGMDNLMGSEIQKCINCLCHARTGCWRRINCARYSISKEYWRKAGSPSLNITNKEDQAYLFCMNDENCILNTIKVYTETVGTNKDCNCDGTFDCKDRFAVHLFGEGCMNPNFGEIYARRFNECSKEAGVSSMSPVEGDCDPEIF